jgi:hypothetical protein
MKIIKINGFKSVSPTLTLGTFKAVFSVYTVPQNTRYMRNSVIKKDLS